ncbi:MAG TPA: hypothetical protein VL263_06745 [Vicinamibacterales bacterium]|nr:hypothetical protein [Vicinamibacterales bacterium]
MREDAVPRRTGLPGRPGQSVLIAVLVIAGSFTVYRVTSLPTAERWQTASYDPGDYRFIAEYFWGLPYDVRTYDMEPGWPVFLQTVPFRGIGLGTAHLLVGLAATGRWPLHAVDLRITGQVFSAILKILLAGAEWLAFVAVRRRWGRAAALVALLCLAVPPSLWRLTDDLMTEPVLRIAFILLFALAVGLDGRRRSVVAGSAIVLLLIVCVQVKSQWVLAVPLLVPVLLLECHRRGVARRHLVTIGALAVLAPLSLLAVNWIGWRTVAMNPGVGIHLNIRHNGEVLASFCDGERVPGHAPAICDSARPTPRWWRIYVGPAARLAEYQALDRYALSWVRSHPRQSLADFVEGLGLASIWPRGTHMPPPESAVLDAIDGVVWLLLIAGLRRPDTRLPCALALVLWIVPATGNVISIYDTVRGGRYHLPMMGIAPAAASVVVLSVRRRRAPSLARFKPILTS